MLVLLFSSRNKVLISSYHAQTRGRGMENVELVQQVLRQLSRAKVLK